MILLSALLHMVLETCKAAAAALHVSRTICRRAERRIIALKRNEETSDVLLKFVNRLSDVLYTYARYLESELQEMDFEKAYNENL